jgi:hypothetical protein
MKRLGRPVSVLVLIAVLGGAGALAWALSNVRQGYEPRQPIYFRHSRMASDPKWTVNAQGDSVNIGGFSIPCVYCHTMPYKGRHSTVPSTAVCMNCHTVVGQNREWVLKLKEYYDRGEPIPWVKVHDLPDFVYYDHSAHLNARDAQGRLKLPLACETCHGRVQDVDLVRVQTPFNMGWCLECHRKPEMGAPTDCSVCHR